MDSTKVDASAVLPKLPNFKLRRASVMETEEVQGYISAKQLLEIEIEHTKRKLDAGKFLIEARMDLWDIRQPHHYFDAAHDRWDKIKAANLAERETSSTETTFLGQCF